MGDTMGVFIKVYYTDNLSNTGTKMTKMKGQCMCGNIKVEINGAAEFSIICACTQCQKITGTGHAPAFSVLSSNTSVTGELSLYEQKADDGNSVTNTFCSNCGNPIYKMTTAMPKHLFFHISVIDDNSWFKPDHVVYTDSAQVWDNL